MTVADPLSPKQLATHTSAFRLLEEREGKRWVRRRENAKFVHNPHVAPPTSLDLVHPIPQLPLSTFPHPLPSYLPRTLHLPPARPPPTLTSTSTAGLFSLSLRGARRALRARPSSPLLVKAIETHLAAWLDGGTYLNPDQAKGLLSFPGAPVGSRDDIREVGREAGRLVWAVKTDPADQQPGYGDGGFERYVVHCVARWYGLVSFSKETDGRRLTYLFRPNVTRPDPRVNVASRTLDTPPATDASDFHASDASPSDFHATDGSDYDPTNASDADSVPGDLPSRAEARSVLSDIDESRPPSPDSWSVPGGSDVAAADHLDGGGEVDDRGFAASMESLSLSSVHAYMNADGGIPTPDLLQSAVANVEPKEEQGDIPTPSRARADRDRLRRLYPRSASSPSPVGRSSHRFPISRNPGARRKRKVKKDKKGFAGAVADKGSFYDYLFA